MIINDYKLIEIFCSLDDFVGSLNNYLSQKSLSSLSARRGPNCQMSKSELLTIEIMYHLSGYKTFKDFYIGERSFLSNYFPKLLSYSRFVAQKGKLNHYLWLYIHYCRLGAKTQLYYIDSTKLQVCDGHRRGQHKVFQGLAKSGRTSMGWFFGLKLHLVVNHLGELMSFQITSGNVSDSNNQVLGNLLQNLKGKVFGDKGYIGNNLFNDFLKKGVKIITRIKRNMKNKLIDLNEKMLLRKRGVVESCINLMKCIANVEHSRHRNHNNAITNILAGLAAYTHLDHKPNIMGTRKAISKC